MSQFTSAQSLLSLPGELHRPNPYQVFGLRTGESDSETIAAAIRSTIRHLKETKAEADPAAWNQAAAWVTAARGQLSDPVSKQRLDEALPTPAAASRPGVTSRPTPSPVSQTTPNAVSSVPVESAVAPAVDPVVDPLAGLLPGDDSSDISVTPSPAPVIETKPRLWAGRAVLPPSAATPSPTAPRLATPPPTPLPPQPIGSIASPLPDPLAAAASGDPTPGFADWLPAGAASPFAHVATTPVATSGTVTMPASGTGALPASGTGGLPFVPSAPADRRSPGTRRRGSGFPWVNALMFLFAIACLIAVGGLIFAVYKNPQGMVITLQTGGTAGNPGQPSSTAAAGGTPDPVLARPGQADGGEAADRRRPGPRRAVRTRASTEQLSEADRWVQGLSAAGDPPSMNDAPVEMPAAPAPTPTPPAPETPTPDPTAPIPDPTNPDPTTPDAPTEEPMVPADGTPDPLSEAGEAALQRAREAVGKGEWATMVELAAAAAAAAVTEPQKVSAARLERLADMATYYHAAIEKGLSGLGAGESFNLTEQLQIVVVEITPEKLIVRFNGRNKEYPRGELPLVMAHKLARFALPTEAPLTELAAEAYQAIAPISNAQYRQQSLRKLEAMPEMVEDLRPADLVVAIRELELE